MKTLLKETIENSIRIPRLAFLGVGWIGRNRMESVLKSKLAEALIIADSDEACLREAQKYADDAIQINAIEDILSYPGIDGIVIATPNSFHAAQAIAALEKGIPVFCQKPLGRNSIETELIINTAKKNNKLLGVDLSYRYTDAYQKILERVKDGELGKIFAADLVFHNAYGPGKSWFYDTTLSGGGCVIDLGIHLLDLALFTLDFPKVKNTSSSLFYKGQLLKAGENKAEDYASAKIELENDIILNLNCSWDLSAGVQAIIEISFYGTKGGASIKNANGSYYDFNAEIYHGTSKELIASPPDDWGGRALIEWTKKLTVNNSFDHQAEEYLKAAEVIDKIYQR
jgi:predicted dehydrogenase